MSSPAANLNRFIFFPQGSALTATLLTYVLIFGLAASAQYTTIFSDIFDKLAASGGNTLGKSCLFAAAIYGLLLLTTYLGISPYYLSGRQALEAMPGSAAVVLAVFFTGWSALQLLHHQDFVLFTPEYWSAKITLNNLTEAGILALLSPIGLRSSIVLKGALPHDFTGVHRLAREFRTTFDNGLKQSPGGGGGSARCTLGWDAARRLREILGKMATELEEKPANPMQPVAKECTEKLNSDIALFIKSYDEQTGLLPDSYRGSMDAHEGSKPNARSQQIRAISAYAR